MKHILKYLGLVKFAHTVFAMPFALIGYFIGVSEIGFNLWALILVTACMVFARNAAMGFNRLVDRHFDASNPRTANREIPAGKVSVRTARTFVAVNCIAFVACAGLLNPLCLILSPVALAVVLGYSYTKRFTAFCHLILGLGLAIAPVGAYIAATGHFAILPLIISGLVLTWTAGFDVIFALQDVDFDKSTKLHSIPARLGIRNGLIVSATLHILTTVAVLTIGIYYMNHPWYWIGGGLFTGLLIFQHAIVRPGNLSRVNLAFGTTNGVASILYAVFTITSLFSAPIF